MPDAEKYVACDPPVAWDHLGPFSCHFYPHLVRMCAVTRTRPLNCLTRKRPLEVFRFVLVQFVQGLCYIARVHSLYVCHIATSTFE
uniref:Uncharacterized protein n=1 Tax=Pararge aegeria TaxID=116150 RepID=S4PET6_9NEOP